jgi:cytochrome c oxidase cbb3-type subunit 3
MCDEQKASGLRNQAAGLSQAPGGGLQGRLDWLWGLLVAAAVMGGSAMIAAQGGPYQRQVVDAAAAGRGRAVYAQHCINCHGSTAKGSDRGPDLIRSAVVLRDRLGNGIGAAIKKSATHQADLTDAQVVDLSHFLHQRVESTASNRTARAPLNVLTGDPEAGRAYFNGAGKCSTCHSPTGDLAGIAQRIPDAVNLQQRWLFPSLRRGGPKQVEVTVTPPSGRSVTGTLVRVDDFSVALRDASGEYQSFTRGPGVVVAVQDPLAMHQELLDKYTDADMHNVTTYLSILK